MSNRPSLISTAFWTYVIPMTTARAMRIGIGLFFLFIAMVVLLFVGGVVSPALLEDALYSMRSFVVMLGVPVGALLLSEMPIRDGITHRTLLYPMLGPVPRTTLVIVRTLVTATMLALAACVALILIRILLRDGFDLMGREILAVTLGSLAYVAMFGVVHLITRRGLITALVVLFLFDLPIGRLPFSLRNLSPSYHTGVIANQQETMELPVRFGVPDTSIVMSALILLVLGVLFVAAVAAIFKRKDLGTLC